MVSKDKHFIDGQFGRGNFQCCYLSIKFIDFSGHKIDAEWKHVDS